MTIRPNMDYSATPCKLRTDVLQRLSTYGQYPIPIGLCSSISNSPSKFAAAYFERREGASEDEVWCRSCGVTFSDWKGENPLAVHRVVSQECPALNTPPAGGDLQSREFLDTLPENPYREYLQFTVQQQPGDETPTHSELSESRCVRRQLFSSPDSQVENRVGPSAASPEEVMQPPLHPAVLESERSSSILNLPVIKHPFRPVTGDYKCLAASYRMNTYPAGYSSKQNQAWAEEGFVHLGEGSVQCAFCGKTAVRNGLHPRSVHKKVNPSCPFLTDPGRLGNISCKEEFDIRMKYLEQQQAKTITANVVRYPHYANDEVRKDTYKNWPKMCSRAFPAELMCFAGFYYSGCTDKVVCFSCGIELYNWDPEADVWQHHAKLSPTCQFVISHKDHEFIQQAAEIEVQIEVKYPGEPTASVMENGTVVAPKIGSATLDQQAIQAAQACGYTLPQIQLAIIKFFRATSRYPNDAILLASLKATDENHVTIVEQQQALHQKDTVIQEKNALLLDKEQAVRRITQETDAQLTQQAAQLTQQAAQLTQQATQLSQLDMQVRMQDQMIQSLTHQVQQLRADRRPPNPAVPWPDGDGVQPAADSYQRLLCKICLSEESSMIFLPCGHVTSCVRCASRLPDRHCPVCRQDISEKLPAFVV